MDGQSLAVSFEATSWGTDAFRDVEYDAGESILIDPYLLVVWYLAKLAVDKKLVSLT